MRKLGIEEENGHVATKRTRNSADLVLQDSRWAGLISRDPNANGKFFLFSGEHGSLLSALLWRPNASTGKRALLCHDRGGGSRGISGLQKTQAQ
jgi:hypothetical protein